MTTFAVRPVHFSSEVSDREILAILAGQKTQMRFPVALPPEIAEPDWLQVSFGGTAFHGRVRFNTGPAPGGSPMMDFPVACPFGKPGDRLWVREAMVAHQPANCDQPPMLAYRADSQWVEPATTAYKQTVPPIHMPRWASRIELMITGVRVERLHSISAADARAEGVDAPMLNGWCDERKWAGQYMERWCLAHGGRSWNSNPWVWVILFDRVQSSSGSVAIKTTPHSA